MTYADGGMVFKPAARQAQELVLQIGDFGNAAASEISVLDGLARKLCLARIDFQPSVLSEAVGEGHFKRRDASLIAAPARSGIALCKHLVLGDRAFPRHERLCYGTAVEQNYLVFIVAVVVVPVKASRRLSARKRHCTHGDRGTQIDLARGDNAAVVELGQKYTRADAENGFHFIPAAERDRVELVLPDVFVDDNGDLGKRKCILFGYLCKVGIGFQPLFSCKHGGIVVPLVLHFEDEFGQIKALHVDSVALEGHLIEAHRLERRRARADTAEVKALHPLHHAADRGEVVQVFAERGAQRMHDVRLHHRERDPILIEHVRHGKFAAEGVAAVGKVHFADLIGIRLHEDGNARILQRRHRAVFIDKDGHAQNDAVVLALMALQPIVIQPSLFARFHRAVTGGIKKRTCCQNESLKKELLEQIILDTLTKALIEPNNFSVVVNGIMKLHRQQLADDTQLRILEKELQHTAKAITGISIGYAKLLIYYLKAMRQPTVSNPIRLKILFRKKVVLHLISE